MASSRALEIAGVTRSTPQPKGGVIRKDPATGGPNGVFEESGGIVSRHIPAHSLEDDLKAVEGRSKTTSKKASRQQ